MARHHANRPQIASMRGSVSRTEPRAAPPVGGGAGLGSSASAAVGTPSGDIRARRAFRFVLLIGILSLSADYTYEGSRSVLGPFLATLSASGAIVGVVTGFGELAGYGLRLVSGRVADATGRYWPITIVGYVVQMASVPALALVGSWQSAALLIVLERVGKAMRNPPRDVMLSHAAKQIGGYGWAFGLHEALDQLGALFGPLAVAAVLGYEKSYVLAFAVLTVPAAINLALLFAARLLYPHPQELEAIPANVARKGFSRTYWIYFAGAALAAAGFADYPILAFDLAKRGIASGQIIAVFYAVAMAVSGAGSLAFGKAFDRRGIGVLIALTLVSTLFAPLVFLGDFWSALAGAAIWGLGMGVHESIIPAAVAPIVAADRRASAIGLFTAGYGIAWFAGSAAIGLLYDRSIVATVTFCVATQFAALPFFGIAARHGQRAA